MGKRCLASLLAIALFCAIWIPLGAKNTVRADGPETEVFTAYFLSKDLHDVTSDVYYQVSEDGKTFTEKTADSADWNFAYLKDEYKMIFRDLKVTNSRINYYSGSGLISLSAREKDSGEPVQCTLEIIGNNVIDVGNATRKVDSIISTHGLRIVGSDPKTDTLSINIQNMYFTTLGIYSNTFYQKTSINNGSLNIENVGLNISLADCEGNQSNASDYACIRTVGNLNIKNSELSLNSKKYYGYTYGIWTYNNFSGIQPTVSITDSTVVVVMDVQNNGTCIYGMTSISIDNSQITCICDDIANNDTTQKYTMIGMETKRSSSGSNSIWINNSTVEINLGDMTGSKSTYNAYELDGLYTGRVTILDSVVNILLNGARNMISGIRTVISTKYSDTIAFINSNVGVCCTNCTGSSCYAIFGQSPMDISGEGYTNLYAAASQETNCATIHLLGNDSNVHTQLDGFSYLTIGGTHALIDCKKACAFTLNDHAELTFMSESKIASADCVGSSLAFSSGYDANIYEGESANQCNLVDATSDATWSMKYLHVDAHHYHDCEATKCDYPNCGHERQALFHTFEDGCDYCSKCGYIRSVKISDLAAPEVDVALDQEVSCNVAGQANVVLEWTPADSVAKASTAYSASFTVTPKDGYFFNDKTTFFLNGEEVSAVLNENGSFTYTKNFEKLPDPVVPDPDPVTPGPDPVTPDPDPVTPAPQPVKDPSFEEFIDRLYLYALQREPEADGKAFWMNKVLNEGFTGGRCAYGFLVEAQEFLNRDLTNEQFIDTLYQIFFDRAPDEGGKAFWLEQFSKGMTRAEMVNGFIDSTEWCNLCASYGVKSGAPNAKAEKPSKNAEKFAYRLYAECLGREPEADGLKFWALRLTNLESSGYEAALGFFTSEEFTQKGISDDEFIHRLYRTFMGRDEDEGGFAFWKSHLGVDMTREELVKGFAQSQEFTNICNQYGIDKGI